MITKAEVRDKALSLGFDDVGFASAEPFDGQREVLQKREREYGWVRELGLDLVQGTDPASVLPGTKSIVVLLWNYYRQGFPRWMEGHFGRCYLDDDRVTKDGMSRLIKAFREFLTQGGARTKVPFNLPHRAAATRAGVGSPGRNCLLYANRVARGSSFVLPVAVLVDQEFEPDPPTQEYGCPKWCGKACLAACPTKALKGDGSLDPRKCISFLTYLGQDMTPLHLRELMGISIFGCDRCQEVCPRNTAWMARDLPLNERVAAKEKDFQLPQLLSMDSEYFEQRIWPYMFYIPSEQIWKWKMNVARAMGNTGDREYVPDLVRAFEEHEDWRVKGMCAWALGRLGGEDAVAALKRFASVSTGTVREEVDYALGMDQDSSGTAERMTADA